MYFLDNTIAKRDPRVPFRNITRKHKSFNTSCETLHPCMELEPHFRRSPSSSDDTFSVIGSDKYAPILDENNRRTKPKKKRNAFPDGYIYSHRLPDLHDTRRLCALPPSAPFPFQKTKWRANLMLLMKSIASSKFIRLSENKHIQKPHILNDNKHYRLNCNASILLI